MFTCAILQVNSEFGGANFEIHECFFTSACDKKNLTPEIIFSNAIFLLASQLFLMFYLHCYAIVLLSRISQTLALLAL